MTEGYRAGTVYAKEVLKEHGLHKRDIIGRVEVNRPWDAAHKPDIVAMYMEFVTARAEEIKQSKESPSGTAD